MLDRTSYIPLYVQLRDEIKNKIDDGFYKTGEMIPSEKEFMSEFKVGRATVREAVNHLVLENILEKRQGVGTFVCQPNKKLGFEPIISLSYMFRYSGISLKNELIKVGIRKTTKEIKAEGFTADDIFEIRRIRYNKKEVAIVERIVFRKDFKDLAGDYDFTRSIGKLLINIIEKPIERISQDLVYSKPSSKIYEKMGLDKSEKILSMRRKIYLENDSKPCQYYEMWVNPNFSDIALKNVFVK